jgi:hypothetical protein
VELRIGHLLLQQEPKYRNKDSSILLQVQSFAGASAYVFVGSDGIASCLLAIPVEKNEPDPKGGQIRLARHTTGSVWSLIPSLFPSVRVLIYLRLLMRNPLRHSEGHYFNGFDAR